MKVRRTIHYTSLNEVAGKMDFEVEIGANLYPAESMVRYYDDGSGYPGAPAFAEITSVWVSAIHGEFGTVRRIKRNEEWFVVADAIANNIVSDMSEKYENEILESQND